MLNPDRGFVYPTVPKTYTFVSKPRDSKASKWYSKGIYFHEIVGGCSQGKNGISFMTDFLDIVIKLE